MNFSRRSYEKELLDRDDLAFDDIRQNMQELDFINTYLGGHKITIDGLKELVKATEQSGSREWVICEVGCGGGDNLAAIARWCKTRRLRASFIGIDINPYCIEVAAGKLTALSVKLICSDYALTNFNGIKPDFVFTSLFCHHFTDGQLVDMLQWMQRNSREGFFINDLHRHPLAYYSIKILTRLFSASYLVKNDAPLSVRRGFTSKEWKVLLESAGISRFRVSWKWAFRHLVVVRNASPQTGSVLLNEVILKA